MDIDLLQNHGIVSLYHNTPYRILSARYILYLTVYFLPWFQNVADIKKLKTAGICTIKVLYEALSLVVEYWRCKGFVMLYTVFSFFSGCPNDNEKKVVSDKRNI